MKKIILIALMAFGIVNLSAQKKGDVEFGVNIGFNSSSVSDSEYSYDSSTGLNVGGSLDYYFSSVWSLKVKMIYEPIEIYCHKTTRDCLKQPFEHFAYHPDVVAMYGSGNIVKVRVSLEKNPTKNSYWAWYHHKELPYHEKDEFGLIIYAWRQAVEMCFPYGTKIEEEHGRGKIVRVKIEEVE